MEKCAFCGIYNFEKEKIIFENQHFFAIYDKSPSSKGHTLIISKRHFTDVFFLISEEWENLFEVLQEVKNILLRKFKPDGFNIFTNIGFDAGQTVFHFHVHLIPRYKGFELRFNLEI